MTDREKLEALIEWMWGRVERLVDYPFPQICRHVVAADFLEKLEELGEPVTAELAGAVVRAEDWDALELLKARKCPETNSSPSPTGTSASSASTSPTPRSEPGKAG